MDLGLSGKTAIVTGGGSNIGRASVLALAREGANVVIADYDEIQALKVVGAVKAAGGKAVAVKTDVTDHLQVEDMVRKVLAEFGRVHVLINNVGGTVNRLFVKQPRSQWEKDININLWSVINCTRAVLDHMIEHKYGKIVSMCSDAGRMGEYEMAVYAAAKAGVIALSKSIAREVGRYGINVNTVCLGLTPPQGDVVGEKSIWRSGEQTFTEDQLKRAAQRYPLRRLAAAEEVANGVVFMASEAASFITGQTLSVNGGYFMP